MKLDKHVNESSSKDGFVKLSCGCKIPVMSAACSAKEVRQMPVVCGLVDNQSVLVLIDIGCSGVVARKDLVSNAQMTDHAKTCILIDGRIFKVSVANIYVDTPYFTGQVEAMCMNNPVYNIILGNIIGVCNHTNPDPDWSCLPVKKQTCSSDNDVRECNQDDIGLAVETRSQCKAKGKPFKEHNVSEPFSEIVTPDLQ